MTLAIINSAYCLLMHQIGQACDYPENLWTGKYVVCKWKSIAVSFFHISGTTVSFIATLPA